MSRTEDKKKITYYLPVNVTPTGDIETSTAHLEKIKKQSMSIGSDKSEVIKDEVS